LQFRTTEFLCPAFALSLAVAVASSPPAHAQERMQAFVGATIIPIVPIEAGEIEKGILIFNEGRIIAVGPADEVSIPEGSDIVDMAGRVIMPGLICSHSHIGEVAGGDNSDTMHPDVRVMDAINVRHPSIQKAQAGGLTCANLMSGSGHLLSGQTIYLKLRDGRTIDDLIIRNEDEDDSSPAGGIKMANGTNSQDQPPFPQTRARSAAIVRDRYVQAQNYRDKIERADGDPSKMPDRDLGLEALLEVLSGDRVVHHHTHRHDDIMTVLRLKEEFGFNVVLHHVSDGWKIADEIAAAGVPCSIIVIDSPGGKIEARDLILETGAVLEKAGVLVGFHTDDGITDSRVFLRSAALAVRAGMSRQGALAGLTLANAKILGLEDRIGSLEPGKDADFVVLDGDPLSVYTRVQQTWIEGERVFDLADAEDRLYAEGGWGAGDGGEIHGCCFGPGGDR